MSRAADIRKAYKTLGKGDFYDGMITCSTLSGKAVCRTVWAMGREENDHYLDLALSGIPKDFSGKLLEVPVGTGVLTMPVYLELPKAEITCLDYSLEMMNKAQRRAEAMRLPNITFRQGDVGSLPMGDGGFDIVLSLNGFHAFPDKNAAFAETFRVLKPGGIFCGCFYIQGQNRRTDWFVDKIYTPKGYFTPPYETIESLQKRLKKLYAQVQLNTVNSMVSFTCRKGMK